MKKLKIAPILLVAVASIFFSCSGGLTKKITFSRDEIQAKVEPKFPLEKTSLLLLKVVLTNPNIILENGLDRIGLKTDVAIKLPNVGNLFGGGDDPLKGQVHVQGDVEYVSSEGTFYFTKGVVKDIQVKSLPADFQEPVTKLVDAVLHDQLEKVPLMTLNEADLKEKAAKYLLRSVKISNGKLEALIGLGGDK